MSKKYISKKPFELVFNTEQECVNNYVATLKRVEVIRKQAIGIKKYILDGEFEKVPLHTARADEFYRQMIEFKNLYNFVLHYTKMKDSDNKVCNIKKEELLDAFARASAAWRELFKVRIEYLESHFSKRAKLGEEFYFTERQKIDLLNTFDVLEGKEPFSHFSLFLFEQNFDKDHSSMFEQTHSNFICVEPWLDPIVIKYILVFSFFCNAVSFFYEKYKNRK